MNAETLAGAADRLARDPQSISAALGRMDSAWGRIYAAANQLAAADVNDNGAHAAAQAEFTRSRSGIVALRHCPESLLAAEEALPRIEALAVEAEARVMAARESRWKAACERQLETLRGGPGRPSLTPSLDVATPALKRRLDILSQDAARSAHDDPVAFDFALSELEASTKAFVSAIGVERRAARLRASERAAAQVVVDALAA